MKEEIIEQNIEEKEIDYVVRILYFDGKTMDIVVSKSEITRFLTCIQSNEPYWAENEKTGFWTPEGQIRTVTMYEQTEEYRENMIMKQVESIKKEIDESVEEKKTQIEEIEERQEEIKKGIKEIDARKEEIKKELEGIENVDDIQVEEVIEE